MFGFFEGFRFGSNFLTIMELEHTQARLFATRLTVPFAKHIVVEQETNIADKPAACG